jgi:hypothetical protein
MGGPITGRQLATPTSINDVLVDGQKGTFDLDRVRRRLAERERRRDGAGRASGGRPATEPQRLGAAARGG